DHVGQFVGGPPNAFPNLRGDPGSTPKHTGNRREGHPCSTCHVTHTRGPLGHGAHGKSTAQTMATFCPRQVQGLANFSAVTAEKCQLSVDVLPPSVASFSHGLGGSSTTRSTTLRAGIGRGGKERD